jgi:hypothetical protein
MKKHFSRIAALCLSLAMLTSLLCVQASAASSVELYNPNGDANLVIADVTNQRTVTYTYGPEVSEPMDAYELPVGATLSLTVGNTNDLSCFMTPYTLTGDIVAPLIDGKNISLPGGTLGTSATFEVTTAGVYRTIVQGDGYPYFEFILIVTGDGASSGATTPAAAPSFTDVAATSPFYAAIQWAVDQGITKGTSNTTFSPSNLCTNNHILTFLWRANGSPAATVANPFDNIDTSGDFGKAALWAYEQGLVSGTSFPGTVNCTRAQTMLYFWKQAGSPATAVSDKFTDVPADAEYAQAVAWAVAQGITNGTSGTTFSPDATCTRGQIVTFLYRALAV